MNAKVKRIAFLGNSVHFIPTYRAVLNALTRDYTLKVFSETYLPRESCKNFSYAIVSVPIRNCPRRLREFLFFLMVLINYVRKPFDIVHAHSTYPAGLAAVVLGKIFRVKTIVGLDAAEGSAFPDIKFGDLLHKKRTLINKFVINHADVVTVLSKFQLKELRDNLKVEREMALITRGVDTDHFNYIEKSYSKNSFVLLNVGYLNPVKDPCTLIKTFHLIQKEFDCTLIHIGNDYMNGSIQKQATELGIEKKIIFKGFIEHSDLPGYYQNADILLHTARYESEAMVAVEAMASGVIVCGTAVGILSDLSGDCCITSPTQNPEMLASSVINLLGNKTEMERLRMNAIMWARSNNLNHTVTQFKNLYKRLK